MAASWMGIALMCALAHAKGASEPDADASARDGALAIEPVRFVGTRDDRVVRAFTAGLRDHVGAETPLTPTCEGTPCPAAATTLRVEVDERERDYAMTIVLLEPDGRERARRTVSCEVCTPSEAASTAGAAAVELLRGDDGHARVSVLSSPSGAEIWLDGERVGTSPAEISATPGLHTLELRMSGRRSRAQELELAAGSRTSLRIELVADRRGASAPSLRIAGWTLVGVGVAALVGGITLVAIDENPIRSDCDGRHVDRFGNCEYRWNTLAGGATLLAGGLAAAGTGTALLVVGNARRKAELRGGPTHASLTVRF